MSHSTTEAAREVLATVPLIMRAIRAEMRGSREPGLSVPQFRSLGFVHRHPGSSLSDVAEHIGLTLPAMSRLVDGLVKRKLMWRRGDSADRRRLTLGLTPRGSGLLEAARKTAHEALARKVSPLTAPEAAAVVGAMRILREVFGGKNGDVPVAKGGALIPWRKKTT